MTHQIQASCSCGKVTFQSAEPPIIQMTCHCADCRSATGNDYSNIAFFRTKVADISGKVAPHQFVANSGNNTQREACPDCGTVMFDKSDGFPMLVGVFAQQIEPPFEFNAAAHVWVKSKLPHIEISGPTQFSEEFKT
ncbi:MAG: GFA family protein [Anaerolineae bacterium]